MKLILGACAVKGVATILALISPGLHDYLLAYSAFSVPFSLAVLFDDAIANRFGFLILASHVTYLLTWCISQILLRRKSETCVVVGLYCVIGVNLCDMVCAIISCFDSVNTSKVANMLISVLVICLSIWSICREKRNRWKHRGISLILTIRRQEGKIAAPVPLSFH